MDKEIIYFRESWSSSIISDCFTFSIPAALAWANYKFLGDSVIFKITIVIIFFLSALAKGSKRAKRFHSKRELLEYLQQDKSFVPTGQAGKARVAVLTRIKDRAEDEPPEPSGSLFGAYGGF